ncbi:alpha/beta fold hydrolase [Amycolatopsis sp. FDAARGOS 1241]|uniref:alpha/beta fold hydrolase n=1 Tax=Amycolatopsis sp. FDAARGOS 1241 TaxID=2778070 RepID=UPI0019517E1A|nr:alpha/beta hydrolase [Amycolatopsis sp. FDAARGOS 1241]QRP48816.1 alpha/beta hydrolase [Amycolatopsis sp. FDAARGOS 1241]
MGTSHDVKVANGRVLRAHDSGRGESLTVLWHHGTPQTGALLEPVLAAADARGIRVVSYGRPGYGGSTVTPGRTVGAAAEDVRCVADALGLDRFAVAGASGGGSHALACAALLPDRVTAAATLAAVAPYTEEFDWFAGMADPASLRAAREGREARLAHAATHDFNPASFVAPDWAALEGAWGPLGTDAGAAGAAGPDGEVDDDVAYVSPWGFALADVRTPVLLGQGSADRVIPEAHVHHLFAHLPDAQLWLRPRDGHISILTALPVVFDWLLDAAR